MKRDMDLVRTILLALEEAPFDGGPIELVIKNGGSSPEEINYHIMLLHEAGLIKAFDLSPDEFSRWEAGYLTWEGHEFLEAAKDQERWNKTKAIMKSRGGAMVFEVFKSVLIETLKRQVLGS